MQQARIRLIEDGLSPQVEVITQNHRLVLSPSDALAMFHQLLEFSDELELLVCEVEQKREILDIPKVGCEGSP